MQNHRPALKLIVIVLVFSILPGCISTPAVSITPFTAATSTFQPINPGLIAPVSDPTATGGSVIETPTSQAWVAEPKSFEIISAWHGKPVLSQTFMITYPLNDEVAAKKTIEAAESMQEASFRSVILVNNPFPGRPVQSAHFQATVYDEAGSVLGIAEVIDNSVCAQDTIVISGRGALLIPKGTTPGDVTFSDVQVEYGTAEPTDNQGVGDIFSVARVKFWPSAFVNGQVTALVQSHASAPITFPTITAFAFDAQGNLIGAGENVVDYYWYPEEFYPVSFPIEVTGSNEQVGRVEMCATLRSDSIHAERSDERVFPKVVEQGFTISETAMWYAASLRNAPELMATRRLDYLVIFYDAEGAVVNVIKDYFSSEFWHETWAITKNALLPAGYEQIASMEMIFIDLDDGAIDAQPSPLPANPLRCENVIFTFDNTGDNWGTLSATVVNTAERNVYANFYALAYNTSGALIGGNDYMAAAPGASYPVDGYPANGSTSITLRTRLPADTTSVALYCAAAPMGE